MCIHNNYCSQRVFTWIVPFRGLASTSKEGSKLSAVLHHSVDPWFK